MNQIKWGYLLLAVIAALSTGSLGIAVAERSFTIAFFCFLGMAVSFAAAKMLRSRTDQE